MISHSEEKKPFKCSMCVTRFSNRSHLNRHIKFFHLSKTIDCNICKEKFSKKSDYYRHIYSHTKNKPFHCYFPFCKRSYFKQGKLQSHINVYHLQKNDNIDDDDIEKDLIISKNNNFSCETIETNIQSPDVKMSDLIYLEEKNLSKEEENKEERLVFKCPFKDCMKFYSKV